jgi:hypothetical protein
LHITIIILDSISIEDGGRNGFKRLFVYIYDPREREYEDSGSDGEIDAKYFSYKDDSEESSSEESV